MLSILLPSFFLYLFSMFNILGIKKYLFINQIIFLALSLIAYFVIKKYGRTFFQLNTYLLYWFFILTLVFTYVLGLEVKGSRRWIDLKVFNFQPSEFFKVFFILFMAHLLSRKYRGVNEFFVFLVSIFYFIIPTFIIFKQPDLGNALVYVSIFVTMLLFSSLPKRYLIYIAIFLIVTLPFSWFLLKDYQRARVLSFVRPGVSQQGSSYNMIQAIITTGSGQFVGRGLGLGTQSRLYFLPENHTDFAYASLVEQFGFFGGFIVIILYIFLVFRLCIKAINLFMRRDENSRESFLYVMGFMSYIVFQITVNIGMNIGLVPVAGIALPFISYGGSSLMALFMGMAFLP